uniref:THUMP domain-containing protein 1 n=1 Tax=Oryctolagus cuniculus TaxID=9986 RepID=G1U1Z0_RABIT
MAQVLGPCTHVGNPEETPSSWLQIGTAPDMVANWGVNQRMEDPSLFLLLSLCNSGFQVNKISLKIWIWCFYIVGTKEILNFYCQPESLPVKIYFREFQESSKCWRISWLTCLFCVDCFLLEPEKLVHHILQDMYKTKKKKTRVILRMLPIAGTCKAFLEDMKKYAETFLEPWFKAPNKGTFQIVYKSRNNSHVNREEVIKELAGIVGSLSSENKVDLTNPHVVKDYMLFRKYNLQEVGKSPKDPSQLHPKQGNGKEAKLESDDKLSQSDPAEGRNNQKGVPDSSDEKTKPVTETQVVHEGETKPEPASQVTDGSESDAPDVS